MKFLKWTAIGSAAARREGDWFVARIDGATAPASARAFRVAEDWADGECRGFSRTIPMAPTLLGRVYDRVAWWPIFRWLPDLR